MCQLPKLRTIKQCLEWLKENDPETGMSEGILRSLVATGEIPHIRKGKKIFIDLNVFPEALAAWALRQQEEVANVSKEFEQKKEKPLPATLRNKAGGKYGQIRALGQ